MNTLSIILKAVWLYLVGILSVCALYFLLIGVGQGIDVVIQAGEYLICPGISVIMFTVLWAYLLWYSARALSYIKRPIQKTNATQLTLILCCYESKIYSNEPS